MELTSHQMPVDEETLADPPDADHKIMGHFEADLEQVKKT